MDPISILIFVILFGLSAFFSGSEIALMSLADHTVDSLLKQRRAGAKMLKKLKEKNERLLITILIGNNLVNVLTASIATSISIQFAENAGIEQSVAIGIATGIITLLLLLFGEIFPKTLATRHAATISLRVARIYQILGIVLFPIVRTIEKLMHVLNKSATVNTVTSEEVEAFIDLAEVDDSYKEQLKNLLNFDRTVEEIMTPRVNIEAIKSDITIDEAVDKIMQFSHSRIPVYSDTVDTIKHIVTLKHLVERQRQGKGNKTLSNVDMRTMIEVPLTQPIDKLRRTFQKSRQHIAIVIDEYGGVAGLITLEDILEEVFGEIRDETDKEIDPIKQTNEGLVVQADVLLEDILDDIALSFHDLPIDEGEFSGETISYYITSELERFPHKDEEVVITINDHDQRESITFKILSVHDRKLGEVLVTTTTIASK